MPQQVVMGALLQCVPFGLTPSSLIVIPKGKPVLASGMLAATIMDFVPFANILPFGTCSSMSNPVVAAATAAKLGVFTPMPCTPLIVSPWKPGAIKTKINGMPALPNTAICNCMWGGIIKINFAGQFKVNVN